MQVTNRCRVLDAKSIGQQKMYYMIKASASPLYQRMIQQLPCISPMSCPSCGTCRLKLESR